MTTTYSPTQPQTLEVADPIRRLIPYQPGKPIEEVQREFGLSEVIKLASNENPLGPSPRALMALQDAATRVFLYPDGACHDLRNALEIHHGLSGDHFVFGNGSDEIIHLLGLTFLQPGDEVILGDPSFVHYASVAVLNQCVCHKVPLTDWTHDLEAMAAKINAKTRLVFIANCNNPTGTIVTRAQVDAFMAHIPERVVVVLDEAYYEYVEHPDYPQSLDYVREGRSVVILRTFSKAYGLAGLRVGYGMARPDIVGFLNQVREPFNVNLLAQAAAVAALQDTEHVQRTLAVNRAGRDTYYAAFEQLGLPYVRSEGNFVWLDTLRDGQTVFQALMRRGIIVRAFRSPGTEQFIRVTVGTPEQNTKFLDALAHVLKEI